MGRIGFWSNMPSISAVNSQYAMFEIGIISDEVSRDLREAFMLSGEWGISHFELREGEKGRFPRFTDQEVAIVDSEIQAGATITAVSPGIYKGNVEDVHRWRQEAENTTPRAIELARRFDCRVMIAFGFEECDEKPVNRLNALRALETVAEQAAAAGMIVAIENEPGFWVDRPAETVALLEELGHPAVRLNWDPANLHWGGRKPDREALEVIRPYLANLHVKDYTPDDPDVPWRPLGDGIVPWPELLPDILAETDLTHGTIETHCEPLIENSQRSLEALRGWLGALP